MRFAREGAKVGPSGRRRRARWADDDSPVEVNFAPSRLRVRCDADLSGQNRTNRLLQKPDISCASYTYAVIALTLTLHYAIITPGLEGGGRVAHRGGLGDRSSATMTVASQSEPPGHP